MNTQMIRVQVTSPAYRNSVLATGYTLLYNSDTNECELEIMGVQGTIINLNVSYEVANNYMVQVESVDSPDMQMTQFNLGSVHPEESV